MVLFLQSYLLKSHNTFVSPAEFELFLSPYSLKTNTWSLCSFFSYFSFKVKMQILTCLICSFCAGCMGSARIVDGSTAAMELSFFRRFKKDLATKTLTMWRDSHSITARIHPYNFFSTTLSNNKINKTDIKWKTTSLDLHIVDPLRWFVG